MINRVDTRSRTRGKSPVEFTYQGVGIPKSRKVIDKDGLAIVMDKDGNQVKYAFNDKGELIPNDSGITVDDKGNITLPEGMRFVEVDDLDVSELAKGDFNGVVELYGSVQSDVPVMERIAFAALNYFNETARSAASPVKEIEVDDELAPIVTALTDAGLLTADTASVWRRSVSTSAKLMEIPRIKIAEMTKEYKAAITKGVKFPEAVAE